MFGPKGYVDLRRGLPTMSENVLSQRLRELEQTGLFSAVGSDRREHVGDAAVGGTTRRQNTCSGAFREVEHRRAQPAAMTP
jgi:hypothetical protein